ncbi:uncharacterized protein LOC133199956 [Saccostrea echinata]|uniref:uncharacterized protein LOC133199956 n=1 Tax=Saccostrea echinata TaxID=191078 RepID=UPI002A829129|nr:uncharacterized protein LOC133199956 [Saccostrea echinata]
MIELVTDTQQAVERAKAELKKRKLEGGPVVTFEAEGQTRPKKSKKKMQEYEQTEWIDIRPVGSTAHGGVIEFNISGASTHYLDLSRTRLLLRVRILNEDGSPLKEKEKIQDASTEDQYKEAINNDWILDHGLAPHNLKMERRDEILKILFKNEIYYRVHSEISQFTDGLDQVGNFAKAIAKAPEALECLSVAGKSSRLMFGGLRKLYDIEFSPAGSNNRRKEDEVIYCFEAMCADCEANILEVTLNDLLAFWTGAAEVPPLGFDKRLKIRFKHQLRVAHTCELEIHLWRGYSDPDNFRDDMVKAIQWGGGFYLA